MTLLERDKEKFQEGIEQASKQMAKKLVRKDMSIEEVIAITELSKEEIEKISNNI